MCQMMSLELDIEPLLCENLYLVSNVGTQVMLGFNNTNPFKFECVHLINLIINTPFSHNISKTSNTKDISCDSDVSYLNIDSFLGFHSIKRFN